MPLGLLLAALAFGACAHPWQLQLGVAQGTPGGLIQVRENNVEGTPLPIGPELGINHVQHVNIGLSKSISTGRKLIFNLDLARMHGETVYPQPVYFNGVQLAAGYPLTSDASWMENWQVTGLYRQQLYASAGGMQLDGEIGFTYVGLTYSLQGHPVGAASPTELSGDRTKEDFITQELPVPQFGLHFSFPLHAGIYLDAEFIGGHLPRLYSLRNEGGKVYVTQTNQEARLGLTYHWTRGLLLGFGWYDRYFMQYEDSAEDGNYIRLSEHGYYLNMQYEF